MINQFLNSWMNHSVRRFKWSLKRSDSYERFVHESDIVNQERSVLQQQQHFSAVNQQWGPVTMNTIIYLKVSIL